MPVSFLLQFKLHSVLHRRPTPMVIQDDHILRPSRVRKTSSVNVHVVLMGVVRHTVVTDM
jgi:hypothetical protein